MQKNIVELLQSSFIADVDGKAILAFSGVMSQDTIVGLGDALRSELHHYFPLSVVNKVFAIYIEMAQNVLHYSHSKADINGKETGVGSILVFKMEAAYQLVSVNLITQAQKDFIEKKINVVNQFTFNEIREFYLKKRKESVEGNSKGAGLGFIDIIRRTTEPLQYDFEPVDDNLYYFYLSSRVLTS